MVAVKSPALWYNVKRICALNPSAIITLEEPNCAIILPGM
jgi:hypothetical protein